MTEQKDLLSLDSINEAMPPVDEYRYIRRNANARYVPMARAFEAMGLEGPVALRLRAPIITLDDDGYQYTAAKPKLLSYTEEWNTDLLAFRSCERQVDGNTVSCTPGEPVVSAPCATEDTAVKFLAAIFSTTFRDPELMVRKFLFGMATMDDATADLYIGPDVWMSITHETWYGHYAEETEEHWHFTFYGNIQRTFAYLCRQYLYNTLVATIKAGKSSHYYEYLYRHCGWCKLMPPAVRQKAEILWPEAPAQKYRVNFGIPQGVSRSNE